MRDIVRTNMWRRNSLKPGSIKSKEVSLGYLLCIWLFICVLLEHKYWIPPIVLIPFLPPTLHVWIFRIEWTMTGRKSWIMIMISFAHKTQSPQWSLNMQILLSPQSQPWWCQAAVHWTLVLLPKMHKKQDSEVQVQVWRRQETRLLIWSRHEGPDQWLFTLHKSNVHCTVRGSRDPLTLDTTLVGGRGGCGDSVTVSETMPDTGQVTRWECEAWGDTSSWPQLSPG